MTGSGRLRRLWQWLGHQLDTHPVRFVFVVGAIFTLALINVKLFAAGGPWWRGWADQRAYLASAKAFAAFDLDPAQHWYPLVYPLLGAPFTWLIAAPFVPANLACYALAFAGFRRVCARLEVGHVAAGLLFLATTLLDPRIGKLWVEPWTTTASAALIWQALGMIAQPPRGRGEAVWLGVALALIPLVRPADAVVSAIIGLFALSGLVRSRQLLAVILAGLGTIAAYVALHLGIYGPRWSDYVLLSREYGLNFADLGWKAQVLLTEPEPWFPGETGLLRQMPWLVLAAAGWVLAVLRMAGERGVLLLCMGLGGTAYCAVLFAYVDLLPSGLWRFNNIHYFKWLLPMAGLTTLLFVRLAMVARVQAAAIVAVLILATCPRYVPVPAAPEAPARALLFAAPGGDWNAIYSARSVIEERGGTRRNIFDYHQIVRPDRRVIATALKRDFQPREAWWGNAAEGQGSWPVGHPARAGALGGSWPRAPEQRLTTRLVFGYPCWLPPYGCAQTLAE